MATAVLLRQQCYFGLYINQNPKNTMKTQTASAKKAAVAIKEAPVFTQKEVLDSASESNPTTKVPAALGTEVEAAPEAEAVATDTPAEARKRERNYSQSAINTADLERLSQLKTFVKEKLKVTVSNQRIIGAALDCLGDNVEAFLKNIADEANNKQSAKERKAYEVLKARFEASEAPATDAAGNA